MIPLDVRLCVAGEGIRDIGGKVGRGVGVPGVQARFLCVWGGVVKPDEGARGASDKERNGWVTTGKGCGMPPVRMP